MLISRPENDTVLLANLILYGQGMGETAHGMTILLFILMVVQLIWIWLYATHHAVQSSSLRTPWISKVVDLCLHVVSVFITVADTRSPAPFHLTRLPRAKTH